MNNQEEERIDASNDNGEVGGDTDNTNIDNTTNTSSEEEGVKVDENGERAEAEEGEAEVVPPPPVEGDTSNTNSSTGEEQKEDINPDEEGEEAEEEVQVEPYIAPLELVLTRQEEQWTWDIVYWVECHGDKEGLKKPTDYEFVQYALATKGNTEEAVQKIKGMQLFREKYNVQDTVEEGIATIREFIQLLPGVLLQADAFPDHADLGSEGGSVAVFDWSQFSPAIARQNLRNCMLWIYYMNQLFCPNFDAIRGGTRHLWEGGSGFRRENIDLDLEQAMHDQLLRHYPVDYREIRIYNTGFLLNWLIMMSKPFMSSKIRESFHYGCQIEVMERGEQPFQFLFASVPRLTLPDLYFRPNYNVAMQNLLTKAETLLEEHYYNRRTFEF